MKECDIFYGSKHTIAPPTSIHRIKTNPQNRRSWLPKDITPVPGTREQGIQT